MKSTSYEAPNCEAFSNLLLYHFPSLCNRRTQNSEVKQNLSSLLKAYIAVAYCDNYLASTVLRHSVSSELFCDFPQFPQADGYIASFQFTLYIHTVIKHSIICSVDKTSLIKLERKNQIDTTLSSFPFTFKFPPSRQQRKLLMLRWSRRWKSSAGDIKGDGPPNLPICFIYLA